MATKEGYRREGHCRRLIQVREGQSKGRRGMCGPTQVHSACTPGMLDQIWSHPVQQGACSVCCGPSRWVEYPPRAALRGLP